MRTHHAFAQPRRQGRAAQSRLPGDAVGNRSAAHALPRLVDAEPQHLLLEVPAVTAAPAARELPDVRHLVEEQHRQGVRVAAGANVQRDGYRAVHPPVHRRRGWIGVSGDARPPTASVQEHRHRRQRPAPAPGIAEPVVPVELAVDVLELAVERRQVVADAKRRRPNLLPGMHKPQDRAPVPLPHLLHYQVDHAGITSVGCSCPTNSTSHANSI